MQNMVRKHKNRHIRHTKLKDSRPSIHLVNTSTTDCLIDLMVDYHWGLTTSKDDKMHDKMIRYRLHRMDRLGCEVWLEHTGCTGLRVLGMC